jgi:hypothetical protein
MCGAHRPAIAIKEAAVVLSKKKLMFLMTVFVFAGCGGEEEPRASGERQSQAFRDLPDFPDKLAPPPTSAPTTLDLVRYHSPVIYQDTYKRNWSGKEYAGDLIAKINWAGSYTPVTNYDAVGVHPMTPHVYYSLSATQTHYFIGYFLYHVFRTPSYPNQIRHHFDGVTLAVARKGASYGNGTCQDAHGCLVAMITKANQHLYQYNDLSYGYQLSSGSDTISAPISTTGVGFNGDGADGRHPRIYVSHSSHNIYSCEHTSKASCGSNHSDGIIYYLRQSGTPSAAPDPSTGGAGSYTKRYAYGLIALDATSGDRGPWALRNYRDDSETSSCAPTGVCTFDSWGKLNGPYGDLMPWALDDPDDGPTYAGSCPTRSGGFDGGSAPGRLWLYSNATCADQPHPPAVLGRLPRGASAVRVARRRRSRGPGRNGSARVRRPRPRRR